MYVVTKTRSRPFFSCCLLLLLLVAVARSVWRVQRLVDAASTRHQSERESLMGVEDFRGESSREPHSLSSSRLCTRRARIYTHIYIHTYTIGNVGLSRSSRGWNIYETPTITEISTLHEFLFFLFAAKLLVMTICFLSYLKRIIRSSMVYWLLQQDSTNQMHELWKSAAIMHLLVIVKVKSTKDLKFVGI